MSNWPTWTGAADEEIVLVWFLSCGIKKSAVSKLIAYKCGTVQRDQQDMKNHVFKLHEDSISDTWDGVGPLLVPKRQAPTSHAEVPEVWTVDWKDCWKEDNVDKWLIRKANRVYHLDALTFIGKNEEDLIYQVSLDYTLIAELANGLLQEQLADEISWDWMEDRQRDLVRRHLQAYSGNRDN